MQNVWLYEKTFWKLLDYIAWDTESENNLHTMKIMWYEDVDFVFKKLIDRKSLEKKTKILFNYNQRNEWEQQSTKGLFG